MKKRRCPALKPVTVFAFLYLLFFSCAGIQAGPPKFSLKLGGGADYLSGGDLNAGIRGMSAFQLDNAAADNELFKELHYGPGAGVEILMEISRRLEISFGIGYLYASRLSSTSYVWNSAAFNETVRPRVEVVPLTVGFSFRLAQTLGFGLYLDAGAGLYRGRMAWKSDIERTIGSLQARQNGEWKASKSALGFQGGLRLEKRVSDSASLYVEAAGRYARFRDIRGQYKVRVFDGADFQEELGHSTLWAADYLSGGASYPWLVFSDSKPTALYYSNAKTARIDISGVSMKAGIRFRF